MTACDLTFFDGRSWTGLKSNCVARTLVFGPSARTGGRQTVVWCEKFKACDLIQGGFRKPVVADCNLSIRLNEKNRWNVLQSVCSRNLIWIFIDQQIKTEPVLLLEMARLIRIVFRNCP